VIAEVRPEKRSIVREYLERLRAARFGVLADPSGMNVAKTTELRARLRGAGARMQVVKNRLFKLAIREAGLPEELGRWLEGPNALIYGEGDITVVSKALRQFIEENQQPSIRCAFIGERILTAEEVEELAKLPSREEMIARVVGSVAAPMTGLVGCLNQMLVRLLYVLRAIEEKKGAGD